jgi:hypothetical protein
MSRMVFDNAMTAHVWAQQSQARGRSSNGNFSFDGPSLYSYSTVIARFVESKSPRNVVLVTSRSYSNTTSGKHMPAMWRGIDYGRGDWLAFTVPHVNFPLDPDNLAHLIERYRAEVLRLGRSTSDDGVLEGYRLERLAALHSNVFDYCDAFGLTAPDLDISADITEINAKRAKRAADNADPVKQAKRAADREKRAAAKVRKEAEARRLALLNAAEKLTAWKAGSAVMLPYDARRDAEGGALLRVRGGNLETSLGATVPLDHAIRVFRFVKHCRETETSWHRNGHTIRVGHFHVDAIEPNGNFRAGCHVINWPEVERIAREIGVIDAAPSAEAVEVSR